MPPPRQLPPPWGWSMNIKLFGILLHERFVSSSNVFIYSVIYLYWYELIDTYFILWTVI